MKSVSTLFEYTSYVIVREVLYQMHWLKVDYVGRLIFVILKMLFLSFGHIVIYIQSISLSFYTCQVITKSVWLLFSPCGCFKFVL